MRHIKLFFLLCLFGMISIGAKAADIPNNEIWYEASSKLTETTDGYYSDGLHTNAFNTTIRSHTFSNGKGIITFNANVTSIGEYAFLGCSGLTSVTIPNSVTLIGDYAFMDCSGLTSVTIPNSVTSIDAGAFYCCFGLKGVNITDLDKWAEIEFGDDSANPLHYAHNLYLNGQLVTEAKLTTSKKIGSYAFNYCSGLTSVTIPNSVTSIGNDAFYCCNNVKELIYAEGTKTVLRTYLTSITSVTIPNSVTSIGSSAFSGCSGLISVTIPNSVTSIDADAFYCCFGLISVTIPNSVTSIEDHVFNGCSGLTSVTIPNSVTSIGKYAFGGCSGLTSVTIPNSVTSIDVGAFWGCRGLTSVYVEWNNADRIPVLTYWDFPYSTCDLYVPTGTKAIYQEKDYWNSFKNICEYEFESVLLGDANDDGSVDVSDITSIATYILNGKATPWNEKNADVNGDGVIDVSDITGVASIILGIKDLSYLTCPDDHHPHAIDLGLPSGTKWCCCNVGATTPEGYGDYYAWGETSEKSVYNEVTYKYCNGEDTDGDGWYDRNWQYQNIGSDIAGTQYDVAHVRMGGSWRMPSHEQQMELKNNCTQTWIQQNGVNGILVTGKNGGQVFLPAAGDGWNDGLIDVGSIGYYWSSSLKSSSGKYACYLFFDSGYWGWSSYYYRGDGLSVRAVCP